MGIEHRPYVGTWVLNNRKLVQHTPDALVYINGDTALPGCSKCGGRIDIQKYITQVSVDAGTTPAGASSSISLAVPLHSEDQFHRDAQFLLRPGLEVHVYFRGYFAVQGMYKSVTPDETGGIDVTRMISYPYFHVFHGVVTQVDHSYSGGFQDISLNAASMLHFWQYHNMSTNASVFGSRPTNSKLKTSMVGHNMTGMTPFSIIYTLFHDTAGAAGGVAFALSSKSNQNAKSTLLNESLFSTSIRYWEQRFSTRMINLRMHGASGQVFSTAQAAFLGRLKGRQVRNILDNQWKVKKSSDNTKKFDIMSAARSLNLVRVVKDPNTGEEVVRGTDVTEAEVGADPSSAKNGGAPGMEVNVASMQAFVSDLGNWGQVNLFESTYETKLDMVNKVLEVTGWEFFQDVDGDFVFKPPLYNLDTRSNRVYRIELIDIISLSHSEKEPEATYVTMTGSQFKNLKGTGLENEWGVRGQYIDYRLVSQFGWRPGSFETSYFSNKRSMFFAAVNRLDTMNVGVNSASLTIPIRPEMRQGYPVYIAPIDCFYYIQSINHSMVFGGQCTTSLSLVGKRAKFYPPGLPAGTSIRAVDLSNTALPSRPLRILGADGLPQLGGMPNTVMALDPNAINPLFFLAGTDLDDISNPQVVKNIIALARQYGIVSEEPEGSGNFVFFVDESQSSQVRVTEDSSEFDADTAPRLTDSEGRVRRTFTFESLSAASASYSAITSQVSGRVTETGELIAEKQQIILDKQSRIRELEEQKQNQRDQAADEEDAATDESIEAEIAQLDNDIRELQQSINNLQQDVLTTEQGVIEAALRSDDDLLVLADLVKTIGDSFLSKNVDFPDPNSSAALLDVLSDKKAIFTNGSQPGFYRYFSSAHPDPAQQGLEELEVPRGVVQYVAPTKPFPDGVLPEAEIGVGRAKKGLRILRPFAEQILSTDQIQTISFQRSPVPTVRQVTSYEYESHFDGLDEGYRTFIGSKFDAVGANATLEDFIADIFEPAWDESVRSWKKADEGNTPAFPPQIAYGGFTFQTRSATLSFFRDSISLEGASSPEIVGILQGVFKNLLFETANGILRFLWSRVVISQTDGNQRAAEKLFKRNLKGAWKKAKFKLARKDKKKQSKSESTYSPVFPISDEGGYQVIGSYRYGRGVLIESGESMEQLAFSDPLQFADPEAVEDFVDVLRGVQPSSLSFIDADGNRTGNEDTASPIRTAAERRLVESILNNPETPDELRQQLTNPDTQNSTGLSNWVARHNEGVLRLAASNSAFTVADLGIYADQRVCDCRADQADILIDAYAAEEFVQVVDPTSDQVTKFSQSIMLQKAVSHGRRQRALRGTLLDRSHQQLSDAFREGVETWDKQASLAQEQVENLQSAVADLGDTDFGG